MVIANCKMDIAKLELGWGVMGDACCVRGGRTMDFRVRRSRWVEN
ncbi:hypothetical protein RESH_02111 [Rhodopirellula europaea SH398]|uniref:Uncharacterized protein n=1 Tax=Rhodopirellula europaea SH398 TaxID=1263868 RepID=M5S722_9BACT|nr:hypothetical protein RESH_02111 [Rhodopirellula europaea SH398]